ncbi:MAG TPA: ribonuclease D [Actinomycetota bacterium]|nr:ribonuclease D [Actinomycetota bacterium]
MIFITKQDDLDDAVAAARTAGTVGLDTEFLREKTYRAKLCLVQMAAEDDIYVIDVLEPLDLKGLADLIADPDVRVILHAGRQDLELFYEGWGVVPNNVYDVQLAAGFAGHGASLPYGRLVETLCGKRLVKGESYTDWCRRPLTEAQLSYAADDVRYLAQAARRLDAELQRLGRRDWVTQEMKAMESEEVYRTDPGEAWRKVGGRGSLSPKALGVLKEVARWREETAQRRDIPRGWVIKDPTMIEIARRAPSSVQALKGLRGFNSSEADRSGRDILAAVDAGREGPSISLGAAPPKAAQARARMLSGLADAVVRARCEKAGMATELVATRSELENLLAEVVTGAVDEGRHRLMKGWRRELAGDAVVALAEGRVAVKAIPKSPFVEELDLEIEKG